HETFSIRVTNSLPASSNHLQPFHKQPPTVNHLSRLHSRRDSPSLQPIQSRISIDFGKPTFHAQQSRQAGPPGGPASSWHLAESGRLFRHATAGSCRLSLVDR